MNPAKLVILQHVDVEGPGRIEESLRARHLEWHTVRIDQGDALPAGLDGISGLVVMGGPMSVYEVEAFPHLREEVHLVEQAVAAGLPVLGVCLGSQLLAAALGAQVRSSGGKEIGWLPVTTANSAATDPLFAGLPARFEPLHWHGDVFDLPQGAVRLASSALTENQAFRFGDRAYGLLFHLEATAAQVEVMARTFAGELAAAGVDPARLVARSERAADRIAPVAEHVFGRWASMLR